MRAPANRTAPSGRSPDEDPASPMFSPVPSLPDFVAQEHEVLAFWRQRGTFAKLRAQISGGPK